MSALDPSGVAARAAHDLTTSRLVLEPLEESHAALLYQGISDPALYRFVDAAPPPTMAALRVRYARITAPDAGAPDRWLNWAMRLRASSEYAGLVEATLAPDGVANLAYFTFSGHMRQGLAREACLAVLTVLRREFCAREVVATMDVRNAGSWRLVEALGFSRDAGTERSSIRGDATEDYRYRLAL